QKGTHQDPLTLDGVKYGILICYEDVLTDFVRDAMDHEPDVLINITNDAWFGKSREPHIHLALSVFRAVEQRRFLVRSTNTGVSAIIGPGGRIIDPTPVFQTANRVGEVAPLDGTTVYQRLGHWFPWLCLLTIVFWSREGLKNLFYGFTRGWAARSKSA
ncbi:MAG: apolipoprotein N-acyltransferase, partial [Myxococcota bacterium]